MPPLPGFLVELVAVRMGRLQPATRAVLGLSAVIGQEFPYRLLRSASDLPEAELLDALDEALGRRVMEESGEGYRFAHSLYREGVYQGLSQARRQSQHGQVARALETHHADRLDDHAETLAYHHSLSDEPWRAAPYLLTAARRASSVFANEQAIRLYRQGVQLLREHPAQGEPERLAQLLEELGDVLRRTGETGQGRPVYEEAVQLYAAAGDRQGSLRVQGKAALSAIATGDVEKADDLLHATLEAINEQSPALVVTRTYYQLAQLHWHSGRHRPALEAAEKALLAARASQDVGEQARAYEALALAERVLWARDIRKQNEAPKIPTGIELPSMTR